METGKGARGLASTASQKPPVTNSLFALSLFLVLICVGCASPGEPIERRPPTPATIADLAAHQSGNTVALTFTLPHETVQNRPLKQPPTIEILRSISAAPPGTTSAKTVPPTLLPLVTIPSAMVDHYVEQGHVHYVDVLQPSDFAQRPNEVAAYVVRTRVTDKKASADSNLVSLPIYPLPDPIDDLKAQIMPAGAGVALTWTPPQKTPIGAAPPIQTYRIYRTLITAPGNGAKPAPPAASLPPFASNPSKMKAQFTQIAETSAPSYEDKQPQFGSTYTYSVRSVVQIDAHELESSDSNPATITMRDIYPPSAPQGLVAVFVPQLGEVPAHLELSWAINPETDVAGYSVYRSEQQGTLGKRLNPELLLTPAFRDMSAVAGRTYFYTVTAVDRSGNESSPSAPVTAAMPAESQ
jgi:hypothetical protein